MYTHSHSQIMGTSVSALTERLDTFDVVPAIESAISQRITDNGTILGLSFGAELRGFEPYSECVTKMERTCPIGTQANRCETPDLDYIIAVSFIITISCTLTLRSCRCIYTIQDIIPIPSNVKYVLAK